MHIDETSEPSSPVPKTDRLWDLSTAKIRAIERRHRGSHETPVHTVDGRYAFRGRTEWTLGFWSGSALQQFDATRADYRATWKRVPDPVERTNPFRAKWELSSATSRATSHSPGTCPPARAACSWTNSGSNRSARGRG
jgi:hypothetical protein